MGFSLRWALRGYVATIALLGVVVAGAIVGPGVKAQSELELVDGSNLGVSRAHTRSEAELTIKALATEAGRTEGKLKKDRAVLAQVNSDVETITRELAGVQSKAAAPVIDAYVSRDRATGEPEAVSGELRRKYLGAQIVSGNEDAIRRIGEVQLKLDVRQAELESIEAQAASLESELAVTQRALSVEQTWLGKMEERSIHERGRQGGASALSSSVNNGRKPGTYLRVCPVDGPHNAIDSFGAPRSGGRRHKGIDIMAKTGVPIVAPASGTVQLAWGGNLGGNVFRLTDSKGNYYYGAHMQKFVGSSRKVEAGELIGYNGNTGNARHTPPHLHFEIRPGGRRGAAINPTPDSAKVCAGVKANIKWRG